MRFGFRTRLKMHIISDLAMNSGNVSWIGIDEMIDVLNDLT